QNVTSSHSLQRIGRAYTSLALLVFNLLLAFACLNLALLPFLPEQEEPLSIPNYIFGPLQYGIENLRPAYPDYTDTQIMRLIIEHVNNLPLACDAELIFAENAFKGHYLNVSDDYYRLIEDQVPLREMSEYYTIFIFGGSTTYGYGEADWQTIPSHLQRILRQQALGGRKLIAIFNFGQRSYFSLQERLLFQQLVRRGFKPDMAVFIDGLNDTHNIGVPSYACVRRDIISRSLRCPSNGPCLPLARLVQHVVNPTVTLEPVDLPPADDAIFNARLIERWWDQWSQIRAFASEENISTLLVRQPVPGFAYELDYHPFANRSDVRITRSAYTYPLWEERVGSDPDFDYLDLAYMSQDRQEILYVDLVHYTGAFMRDIAQEIAVKIVQMMDEPTRRMLGLPRADEPVFRFGASW
ncbi:MAG: SGNH/GDSL hydrolase family protein, partial [Anaerolineae bacterium]|nr:SGNH/GDSL hydrolase family protein [Anaerolineae bacterium]